MASNQQRAQRTAIVTGSSRGMYDGCHAPDYGDAAYESTEEKQ